jgi:hypothetical protein
MTPREAAEKQELEMAMAYFAQRVFTLAGDAAELRIALAEARKPKEPDDSPRADTA